MPVTTVGSQLESEYSISMFMKLTTQSSTVTTARPSRNRCTNGTPPCPLRWRRTACARRRESSDRAVCSQRASVARSRPLTARNCSDSGRPQIIASAMTSGTAPPKMNTDRQPKAGISHAATNPPMRRAHGEADGDAHHQRDATALRAELADERRGVRHDAAHADAGDEPQPQQLVHVLRIGRGDRHAPRRTTWRR